MPDTSPENMQAVKPTGVCSFSKAFGRVMHRIARSAVHVRRLRRHLRMAWWDVESKYRDRERLNREASHSAAEFFKLLLALTGLPRVYRTLDRHRLYKPRTDELDALPQEAVRVFRARLDAASLPPISRVLLYGSRARGDHRVDSDVDIVLVFAGAKPDYDKYEVVWSVVDVLRWNAYANLKKPRVEITSFAYWQDEFDEPDKRFNPGFFGMCWRTGLKYGEYCLGEMI